MSSKTQIVKSEVKAELVPSTKLEGIETALSNLASETNKVLLLKHGAQQLSVNSPEEFRDAGDLLKQVRSFRKTGKNLLGTFEEIIKRAGDFVKSKRTAHEQVCDEIDKIIADKMTDFTRRDRIAKEAEQRRINEEADEANKARIEQEQQDAIQRAADEKQRKINEINELLKSKKIGKRAAADMLKRIDAAELAAIQTAEADAEDQLSIPVEKQEVLPKAPTISGLRKTRNYYAEFTDFDALLKAYCDPKSTLEQRTYWRKFIAPDAKELGRQARETKDSTKFAETVPGVHAWDTDGI